MSEEPKCIEITSFVSWGASVQVVKYEYTPKFSYGYTRKYAIPDSFSEDDVEKFQQDKTKELREELEQVASKEMDDLLQQRDRLKGSSEY